MLPVVALVGRPNVGKSTLVNALVGEERVIAFDQPGTTRDPIEVPFERSGRRYTLIYTAGVRRRGRTGTPVEFFSIVKALQAIEAANVAVLMLDAGDGVTDQDAHVAGYILERGRAVVIVPLPDVKMPAPQPRNTIDELLKLLPPQCVVLNESELPQGSRKGSPQTFAEVMAQWERLHAPFLAAADASVDPMQKIAGYRKTIRVDYACELAHQNLSNAAKQVVRSRRSGVAPQSIPR